MENSSAACCRDVESPPRPRAGDRSSHHNLVPAYRQHRGLWVRAVLNISSHDQEMGSWSISSCARNFYLLILHTQFRSRVHPGEQWLVFWSLRCHRKWRTFSFSPWDFSKCQLLYQTEGDDHFPNISSFRVTMERGTGAPVLTDCQKELLTVFPLDYFFSQPVFTDSFRSYIRQ